MSTKSRTELEILALKLLESTGGHRRVLELASVLSNKGQQEAGAQLEWLLIENAGPEELHHWRLKQNARAPANQYLLINDPRRTRAFREALAAVIQPGCTVLEIGTGSGVLAILAAQAGAGRVVTCEHQPLMAKIAEETVRDNGLEDTITVVSKSADQLILGEDLPELADVLLCDLFTGALLEAGGLGLVAKASESLVKPNGHLLPYQGSIAGCLVGGKDLEALCRWTANREFNLGRFNLFAPTRLQLHPDQFDNLKYQTYSDSFACFDFNMGQRYDRQSEQKSVEVVATNEGVLTGLLQWTKVNLSPGIRLHAAPGESIRWPRFLHVFPEPLQVRSGQILKLNLHHDGRQFSVWPSPLT